MIGNRLIELAQTREDQVESLLASPKASFVIPIPSRAVRRTARQNALVTRNTNAKLPTRRLMSCKTYGKPYIVLRTSLAWHRNRQRSQSRLNPEIYSGVYQHLLQHRHVEPLLIDTLLPASASVYDLNIVASELTATPDAVASIMAYIEAHYSPAKRKREVAQWYRL